MAALDDESVRDLLFSAYRKNRKIESAARAVGITGRTVRNYAKAHPDFADELALIRRQGNLIAHHGPRMLSVGGVAAELLSEGVGELDASTIDEQGKQNLLELLSRHANDGDSKGCAKALHILSEIQFARELLAIKAESKRAERKSEAGDQRPVVIREPLPVATSRVLVAEVLDDHSGPDRASRSNRPNDPL